ncbi:MAG: UbiA family prenyltransferase [Sporichthyaceae bacterium]|nr:UbiA family prenyltransferase [Sporichthyaceae bacterium]
MGSRRFAAAAGLVRAAHPLPCLTVTAIAAGFAAASGRSARDCVAVGITTLAGQLFIGWDNDYVDRDRDAAVARPDKPLVAGVVQAGTVRVAAIAAAVAFLTSLLWHPALAGLMLTLATASAIGYNRGLKAGPLSPLPYAISFGLLPAFVTLGGDPPIWPHWWIMTAAALLGVGAHFANALADIDDDLATGIRGLPARLGANRAALAAAGCLATAGVLLAAGSGTVTEPAGAGLLGINLVLSATIAGWVLAAPQIRSRVPFRLAMLVAVLDVVLLIGAGAAS